VTQIDKFPAIFVTRRFITVFRIPSVLNPCVTFRYKLVFDGENLLAPRSTTKLKDHLLSVCSSLFNIFAATLHILRPSPPSTTRGHAIPWWQGPTFTLVIGQHLL